MLGRLNEALQTAADVLAPPPTILQDFEYHWKHVKSFYAANEAMPKVHIRNTNLPGHLEEMLKLLIEEENQRRAVATANAMPSTTIENKVAMSTNGITNAESVTETSNGVIKSTQSNANTTSAAGVKIRTTNDKQLLECFNFVLANRPLDLLTDIYLTDSPPGASVCILNWIRRFLSCLQNPRMDHASIFQPIQKMVSHCNRSGGCGSPYEEEEIVFLLTVAGVIRKEPNLLHLFLPLHEHLRPGPILALKTPVKNPLFDTKLETNIRRISLIHDTSATSLNDGASSDGAGVASDNKDQALMNRDESNTKVRTKSTGSSRKNSFRIGCDCEESDRFYLFDTVLRYFESADSIVIVRACEAALILLSLPTIDAECLAQKQSFHQFAKYLSEKLGQLCNGIPDDMDNGDIEDCTISWGLLPRDSEIQYFIGRAQLMDFLCWLDYANCVASECSSKEFVNYLAANIRGDLFEASIEPMISVLDINAAGFTLVLTAKMIKQISAREICDELANWLVGDADIIDGTTHDDCLLNIIIENAQDNVDILLPTLQFIEALLDNTNERILHNMIFRYIHNRGYYDSNAAMTLVRTWSDEEDEREKRDSTATGPMKSNTLKPNNILKVINSFLLLLPRQIISDSIGTCYEEYVQDANRHYKCWIEKTKDFNWPIEAVCPNKDEDDKLQTAATSAPLPSTSSSFKNELQSCDSGIAEEVFYEGPLLRLLFTHVRNMAKHPYELNIAVIAILSKLSFLPHPYLHEILLNPEIPVVRGTNTLWTNMQILARQLLLEIPRIEGFQKRISETAKRLLVNPPIMSETYEENDPLFESLVALEEFCKELAAIVFVKYHHATE